MIVGRRKAIPKKVSKKALDLAKRHLHLLDIVVGSCGRGHQAQNQDDAYQDAYLALVRAADVSIRNGTTENFENYAWMSIRRAAEKRLISQARHGARCRDAQAMVDVADSVAESDALHIALESLDPEDLELLSKRYGLFGNKRHAVGAIASERGVHRKTIERLLRRAEARLKRKLEER